MQDWESTINTGNPQADWQTAQKYKQEYEARGMAVEVKQLPTGGYHVKATAAEEDPFGEEGKTLMASKDSVSDAVSGGGGKNEFDVGDLKTVVATADQLAGMPGGGGPGGGGGAGGGGKN